MEIRHYTDVPLEDVEEENVGLRVRWVLGPKTGPKKCYMRVFELQPGGHSPFHRHPGEHGIMVLEGSGLAVGEHGEVPITEGTCIHIPGGELHQLRNKSAAKLVFLCILSSS